MNQNTTFAPLTTDAGYRLEYIVAHEAWYGDAIRSAGQTDPQINIVKAVVGGGGAAWEFTITDRSALVNRPAIQVRVFDETFSAFAECAPLFAALAERQPTNLDGVRAILDELGFTDATERVQPVR